MAVVPEPEPAGDVGAPVGPAPEEEAAFLSDQEAAGESAPAVAPPPAVSEGSLPPMEELVNRIPASAREALDELFRAKFVAVRRFPASVLK